MISVSQILEIRDIHTITLNKIIQGIYFFEKSIFLIEIVGIWLIIKKPIKPKMNKFKYAFLKKENSNSIYKKIGNKVNPAAPGEGIPTK